MSYFPPLYTGWTQSVLLPTTCHRVDLGCLTSHHFTQGGNKVPSSCCFSRSESTISYFTLLCTERTWKILLPTTSHRVDLKCLASECSTQNGPGMFKILPLYTGWKRDCLLSVYFPLRMIKPLLLRLTSDVKENGHFQNFCVALDFPSLKKKILHTMTMFQPPLHWGVVLKVWNASKKWIDIETDTHEAL